MNKKPLLAGAVALLAAGADPSIPDGDGVLPRRLAEQRGFSAIVAEIDAAGNGAHEIRTWLVAAGAAGTGFDVLAYEPVQAWLTGTAVAAARM